MLRLGARRLRHRHPQARVLGKSNDAEQLLEALEEERRAKAGSRKQVRGFIGQALIRLRRGNNAKEGS